ncbi:MAG: PAS-domain containing protein [Sphingomonadaceae bacterium]
MILLTTLQATVLGLVLAVWLFAAAWALLTGLRLRREAESGRAQADRLAALLDNAPAVPLIVRADGRVEGPPKLADWLGLGRVPNFIADFAGKDVGLSAIDATELVAEVSATSRTGRPFSKSVRAIGSKRTLLLRGTPAVHGVGGRGSVVVWVFDATESQAEIARLTGETARLAKAFDALSQLIEAAPIPMWHRGPDLRLTLVNKAYVSAVDAADADEVVGKGLELVDGASGAGPMAAAAAARDAGEVRSRDVPATIGGQRRALRVVDVPLGAAGVAGYAMDNDELVQARSDFRRFVDTQRDTLDRLSAGVAQFANDRTLAFCNAPFQRLFALKPEWVSDRPEFDRVLERMREAGRVPEARDFPAWKAERRQWFTAVGGAAEEAWLLPGGAHLRVVAQPLPDGGLLLVFEDRTEQIQLASARDTLLRVREATFDNLFEAVGVFASDGRLHLWNNKFRDVWGFEEALLAKHPRIDALAEAAAASLVNPRRASLMRDLVRAATVERKMRGGRVAFRDGRHFEFAAVPLPDGNALLTMLDITDSRRVERMLRDRADALLAADKVKSAFVANMSYELRTPLTSIGGFAEMLDKGYAGALTAAAKDYVKAIIEAVATLSSLVDDVLTLTQQDADVVAVDRETVDLVQVLDTVTAEYDTRALNNRLEFVTDFQAGIGRVEGDAKALREAVAALIDNAVRFTPEGGRVLLHASGNAAGAFVVVSDNGPGFAPGSERIDAGGLAGARKTVEAHGGRFTLLSEPGLGTAIKIELPR